MGQGFIEYHLPDSSRTLCILSSTYIHYRLADGSLLHISEEPAWCHYCDNFVSAEFIPSVESLEIELEKFRQNDPETRQKWAFVCPDESVGEWIADMEKRLRWRSERRSPPRCLTCGTMEPIPLPIRGEFLHPKTGERVIVGGSGWADTERWVAKFSPEGVRLAE